jgi:hypothetical protein
MKTFISIFILSVWAVSTSAFAAPPFELPAKAIEVAKGIYDLGTAVDNGRTVRGYAFVRYKKDFAKPDNPGNGNGKGGNGGGGDTTSTCFAFIRNGAKWNTVEDYILNSDNQQYLDDSVVAAQIATATDLWNEQVSGTIFGSRANGIVDGADTTSTDGKNEILFGDIVDTNVIAVTITWGVFSGPPFARGLVEWDQVYDAVDFGWEVADDTGSPNSGLMDMLNIAAHEVGHAAGMGHPDSTCAEETMHATAANGEIKKRDLNAGDIAGIRDLYK